MSNKPREIKFRAWFAKSFPKSNGDFMLYSDRIISGVKRGDRWQSDSETSDDWFRFWSNVTGYAGVVHVMQFTGLVDKNGKEIYEGDVILQQGPGSAQRVIVYYRGNPLARRNNDGVVLSYIVRDVEVIGNIYENPEIEIG